MITTNSFPMISLVTTAIHHNNSHKKMLSNNNNSRSHHHLRPRRSSPSSLLLPTLALLFMIMTTCFFTPTLQETTTYFPVDCRQIIKDDPKAKTGNYDIYPNGAQQPPVNVECNMDFQGGGWTVFELSSSPPSSPKSYQSTDPVLTAPYMLQFGHLSRAPIRANEIYFGASSSENPAVSTLENVNGVPMAILGSDSSFCLNQRFKIDQTGEQVAPNVVINVNMDDVGCLMLFNDPKPKETPFSESRSIVGFTDMESASGSGYQDNYYSYDFSVLMRLNYECFDVNEYNTEHVCSGHGTCVDADTCQCRPEYFGENCEHTTCFGVKSTEDMVCSGFGDCIEYNTCNCTLGYEGESCSVPTCYDISGNDSSVCSGHGTCQSFDHCECHPGYSGSECEIKSPCADVNPGYGGDQCTIPICFGELADSMDVCSGNGVCLGPNLCECTEGYAGADCATVTCFDIPATNKTAVCSGRGTCSDVDHCTCQSQYRGAQCQYGICFGIEGSDNAACYGNGVCIDTDHCLCNDGYKGAQCTLPRCFGKWLGDAGVCSDHGTCQDKDRCECNAGYGGTDCSQPVCYGIQADQSATVCSGHGSCLGPNNCSCSDGYTGDDCSTPVCFDIPADDTSSVCGGQGTCVAPNTCSCKNHMIGEECKQTTCFGIMSNSSLVCSGGKGVCTAYDTCTCNTGYSNTDCSDPVCYGVPAKSASVCSGHGTCTGVDKCTCSSGYSGDQCQTVVCASVPSTDPKVCNGRGTCSSPNACVCLSGYSGSNCETVNTCSGDYTLAISGSSSDQTLSIADSSCERVVASVPMVDAASSTQYSLSSGNDIYIFRSNSLFVVPVISSASLSSSDLIAQITTGSIVGVQAASSGLYAIISNTGTLSVLKFVRSPKSLVNFDLTGYSMPALYKKEKFVTIGSDAIYCIGQQGLNYVVLKIDLSLKQSPVVVFTTTESNIEALVMINNKPAVVLSSKLYSVATGSLQLIGSSTIGKAAFLTAPITSKSEVTATNRIYLIRESVSHVTVLNSVDGTTLYEGKLPVQGVANYRILNSWIPTVTALSKSIAITDVSTAIGLTGSNLAFGTKSLLTVTSTADPTISFNLPIKSTCSALSSGTYDACVETGEQSWGNTVISNTSLAVTMTNNFKPAKVPDSLYIMFYQRTVTALSRQVASSDQTGNLNAQVVYLPLSASVQCLFTFSTTGSSFTTTGTVVSNSQVSCPLPDLSAAAGGSVKVTIVADGVTYASQAFILVQKAQETLQTWASEDDIKQFIQLPDSDSSIGGSEPVVVPTLTIVSVPEYAGRTMLQYGSTLDPTKKERSLMKFKDKRPIFENKFAFSFLFQSFSGVEANIMEQILRDGDNYVMAAISQSDFGALSLGLSYSFDSGKTTEQDVVPCTIIAGRLYSLETRAITPTDSNSKWKFQTQLLDEYGTVVAEVVITSKFGLATINPHMRKQYDLLMGQSVGYGVTMRRRVAATQLDVLLNSAASGCIQTVCDASRMPSPPAKKAENMGWIAAVVIIPLAVIVAIVFIVLLVVGVFLIRRKMNTKAVSRMATSNMHTFHTQDFEEAREI